MAFNSQTPHPTPHIEAILAVDNKGGLAKNGKIPWKSKADMNFFKSKTTNHIVIMGSKTFLSLPNAMPLKNRKNIVITTKKEHYEELYKDHDTNLAFASLEEVIELFEEYNNNKLYDTRIYVIGGNEIYNTLLPYCSIVWLSIINNDYECDLLFNYDLSNYNKSIIYEDTELSIIKLCSVL